MNTSDSPALDPIETQNDRFKQGSSTARWAGLIVATGLHFLAFGVTPQLEAEDVSFDAGEIEVIDVPEQIEIPPPPQAIQRPAVPVVSTTVTADVTIEETTFTANPVEDLPPPPEIEEEESDAGMGGFSVFEVYPRIMNSDEVEEALEAAYPALLKDAGIGGTVMVHFGIDEEGNVIDAQVYESSDYASLDEAALRVAPVYKFSPALNRDKPVRVRVAIPVTFTVR